MKRTSILFSIVAFLGFVSSSYAIIGGKPVAFDDPIARSTVGILIQDQNGAAICTGSLLSNSIVLTAGHCAAGGAQIYIIFATSIDQGAKNPAAVRRVVGRRIDPSYVATVFGVNDSADHSDVALLVFSGGIPSGYVPAKLLPRELAKVALKAEARITLAGYGATDYYATEGSGVLRKINTKIDKLYVSGRSVKVGTSAHGACHGDSGGPALINVNGQNYVFAVTSRAPATSGGSCSGRAVYSLFY